MYLVTSIFKALICYATTVSAAPPSATTPYLVPLKSIFQASDYTIGFPNVSARYVDTQIPIRKSEKLNLDSLTSPEGCRMTSRAEKYTLTVRGTRTALEIVLCVDIPIDPDDLQDTLISGINIFHARLSTQGDGLIQPDPWYAPVVEGIDCALALKSRTDQSTGQKTLTYRVGSDALLGLFKFYRTVDLYTSSLTVVLDKSLAEPDWDVGTIVIGPFDMKS